MTLSVHSRSQSSTHQNNNVANSEAEPKQAIPTNWNYEVKKLSNNVTVHTYPNNAIAIYGIGKILAHEDNGYYVRVAPFENGSTQNWIGVPAFNKVDANNKALRFMGIYENKLTFVQEGFYNKFFKFDLSDNDGNWAPLYELTHLIQIYTPDVIK